MTAKPEQRKNFELSQSKSFELILLNDDFHTFEFVIEKLVRHCKHSEEQAEQCALITHHKGESSILMGEEEYIEEISGKLAFEGLIVDVRKVTV